MRPKTLFIAAAGILAAAIAAWLFPRALPLVALEQSVTRADVLARADSFFLAHQLAPSGARTAVLFSRDDSLRTFVELAGGGSDALNALVRGRDIAPFTWSVRAFVPDNPREASVTIAPDGRIVGFERVLADVDTLPNLEAGDARRIADEALGSWVSHGADRLDQWALVSASFETQKASGRVDHTFTYERTDRRIAGAPIRAEVTVSGNVASGVEPQVEVPQSFARRYAEMRSWNSILSAIASIGILAMVIVAVVILGRHARGNPRWRAPLVVAGVIALLSIAAGLNDLPGSWYWYDTATSPATFVIENVLSAVLFGVATAAVTLLTLVAAESLTRRAFPHHLDWWKLWQYRGTRDVAALVGGGYVVAAIALAYVAVFYLVTRSLFGWWVPSELMDDPNLIATPMPWIAGIAISLNAGVWEEALFRALPLAALSLWVGDRRGRAWWMAGGVVVTALIFGFAHSDYESWPPYSRGVEIFLDACFWAFLFLRFGLLLTVVAHFLYDALLFGIFAASGSGTAYVVSAAVILLAVTAPLLIVLWSRLRQGAFAPTPPDARFAAWTPAPVERPEVVTAHVPSTLSVRAGRLALLAAGGGLVASVAWPRGETLGPAFTATRAEVMARADSILRSRGGDPARWRRLASTGDDTLSSWPRFLEKHGLEDSAQRHARTYVPPRWWVVRYVNTTGAAQERIEEWRVRLWPDGRPLDIRHLVPDSLPADSVTVDEARRIARAELARAGLDTVSLLETDVRQVARPRRQDMTVTYIDSATPLPEGASARAWVQLAGDMPLVARRGVELPETFLRAERARETNQMVAFGVVALVLLALFITGAIVVRRRRPVLLDDAPVEGKRAMLLVGALALCGALGGLNALPSLLFTYDTSQPWGTFIAFTALGAVSFVISAIVVYALWLLVDSLRRRVGIPMQPDVSSSAQPRRDVLVAGLGLGGLAAVSGIAGQLVARDAVPPPPDTVLDSALPFLAGVAEVPTGAIVAVIVTALPLLIIVGLTRRWGVRVVLALMVVALGGVAAWFSGPLGGDIEIGRALAGLVAAAVMLWAVVTWGAFAAWTWFAAALTATGLGGVREAIHAAVWQGRVAGALTALVAVALIAFVVRRVRQS